MARPLTLMAVHAHPDDEASSTGGVLARYGDEDIETVLVTCTNGEFGDSPNGAKPGEPGHDEAEVWAARKVELEASCALLGVRHLELLGYHDSGMMGWEQNERPDAFWQVPVAEAAKPLIALIEHYRPQVIVTYDENGFYGHPDHIQANRITLAACEATDIPDKVYYTGVAKSDFVIFGQRLREAGIEPPFDPETIDFGTPNELIAARIDCKAQVDRKFAALAAHESQKENVFFLGLDRSIFDEVFGWETFVRHFDRTGSDLPEDDLFAGLR